MRILLTLGLLAVACSAFAATAGDDSTVTLKISAFATVIADDIAIGPLAGGSGPFSGTGAVAVTANCPWGLGVPATLSLVNGANSIVANTSLSVTSGNMSGSSLLTAAGAFDIDDPAGTYTGTTTVTVTF